MVDDAAMPDLSGLRIRDAPAPGGDGDGDSSGVDAAAALEDAERVVLKWEKAGGEQMVWEISSEEAADYLAAVDSLQELAMVAKGSDASRVQDALKISRERLQSEFRHLLAIHTECVDPSWLPESFSAPSFSSNADHSEEDGSTNAEAAPAEQQSQSMREQSFIIDLLPPAIVSDLSDIAQRMAKVGHCKECIDAYVVVRKGVLTDSMYLLGVETLSAEDVHRMEWNVLEPRMKKCLKAMKVSFKVLFASERFLCDEVFALDLEESDACFAEMANDAALKVLDMIRVFATPDKPEKLFRLLDMYETLKELLADIEKAFQGELCSHVRQESADVLDILSNAARQTFVGVKTAIETSSSTQPVVNGAVHPLTRYVMNYLAFLSEYLDTMKELFGPQDTANGETGVSGNEESVDAHAGADYEDDDAHRSALVPVLIEILDALMRHADENARLYKDPVLSTIFLMNNTHYIVQKAKHAGIQFVIGDSWLRRHSSLVRYHATHYQRVAWGRIFSFLRDEGIRRPDYSISKEILKERFKNFNAAFEEIHRTQAGWVVSDGLRDELRILIGDKLLPAYRSFLGRYRVHLEGMRHSERYLKYSEEDLENHINNLFVGASHGSMNRRRSSTG